MAKAVTTKKPAATRKTKKTTAVKPKTSVLGTQKPTDVKAAAVSSATRAAPKPKIIAGAITTGSVDLEMKKKELIDKVVLRSGIKKKDAKPVVEAMLAILGETIAEGRELNLQPLGKLKINRMKQVAQSRIIICKLRQSATPKPSNQSSLTDAAE